ncbi:hypothetical protein ABZP36_023239 [Zizania latifolia]
MGLELELPSAQLPPIRTTAAARPEYGGGVVDVAVDAVVHDEEACSTPTSVDNVLRAPAVCPPAPRKPRPRPVAAPITRRWRKKKHARCCYDDSGRRRSFFVAVPHDLAEVFVARRPPDGKKIRVHVVG